MSRRHVAKMLRRMAEIREKRARSEFLKAQTVLQTKKQEREDWLEDQVSRETTFLEENEALTGAILGMLDETRVVSTKKVEQMDEDIAAIGGVVSARRTEHQSTVYRLKGAEKVEEHVKLQHFIDLENQRAMELEDAASANRSSTSTQSNDEVDP